MNFWPWAGVFFAITMIAYPVLAGLYWLRDFVEEGLA